MFIAPNARPAKSLFGLFSIFLLISWFLPAPASATFLEYKRIVTYNMQGSGTQGNPAQKWTTDIPQLLRNYDVILLQEAGPLTSVPGTLLQPQPIPTEPAAGVNATFTAKVWNTGVAASPIVYYIYYLQTTGSRVNYAIVTKQPADAISIAPPAFETSRPALGVRLGFMWYWTLHGLSGGGNDDSGLLLNIQQASALFFWTAMGDYNRDPLTLAKPSGTVIYNSGQVTHLSGGELDYGVSNDDVTCENTTNGMKPVAAVSSGLSSDHFPVSISPFPCASETVLAPFATAPPLIMMAIGDEITIGQESTDGNGYRQHLQADLVNAGINLTYVGGAANGSMVNPQEEGIFQSPIQGIAAAANSQLTSAKPNIVLLHIGTGDMVQNNQVSTAGQRLLTEINAIFAAVPDTTILVSRLITTTDADVNARIQTYNQTITSEVDSLQAMGKRVILVDQSDVLSSDLASETLPNNTGYLKMANAWEDGVFDALQRGNVANRPNALPPPIPPPMPLPFPGTNAGSGTGPCDIYVAGGTPCVAAHSTVRALYGAYNSRLYQVKRASDGTTNDISTLGVGGYANAGAQDAFCAGTTCTITMIYDQSMWHNDLAIEGPGGNVKTADSGAVANALPITVNDGNNKVYGVKVTPGVGYRNNATSHIATGGAPEGMYMVTSGTFVNGACCFDYGNAETDSDDDGAGRMDALNFGTFCEFGSSCGSGPFVEADLENGQYFGNGFNPMSNAFRFSSNFVTAMLKNDGQTTYALKGGDSQLGVLTTEWDGLLPPQYVGHMDQKGAIVLGTGGDNSNGGRGSFFEGAMTAGYPPDETEAAVHANIVAAGYKGDSSGGSAQTSASSPSGPYTGPSDPNGPGPQDGFAPTATEQPNDLMGSRPALASFNGSLYVAFQANDAGHTLHVASSPTGNNFPAAAQIPNVQIGSAPAMAEFNHQLFIAFQANDPSHKLFITSSTTGTGFPVATAYPNILMGSAPAMTVFNSELYMAFQANDPSHVLFVTSSPGGVNWPAAHPIPNVKIGSAPSMAVFNGKLYVAFRANDPSNAVWIASSADGVNFTSQVLGGQKMGGNSSPALVVSNNVLYYIYGANDTDNEMLVTASTDGETWQGPKAYLGTQMGAKGPGAAAFGNGITVGFQSNDSRNVLFITSKATEPDSYTGPNLFGPNISLSPFTFPSMAVEQPSDAMGSKPAIANFNGTFYAAFQSDDSSHTLFVTSSNGANFPHATPYPDITIGSAPAMATFNGQLFIAFQSNDSSHTLFVTSSLTGTGFPHATPYPDIKIGSAPAMVVFHNQLYMAFQSNDPTHTLFVASSPDGVTWPPANPIRNIQIGSAPAMEVFGDKIYIAFRANDASNALWLASSSDGVNFTSQVVMSGQAMGGSSSPALVVFFGSLYYIYGANDAANEMLVAASSDGGETWQGPKAYLDTQMGAAGPAAMWFGSGIYVAFQSNDSRNVLFVTSTVAPSSTGNSPRFVNGGPLGSSFASSAAAQANITLGSKPALAAFDESLYVAFESHGTDDSLFVAASPPAPGLGYPTATRYSSIQLGSAPAMAAFNNQLFIAFVADDSSHVLFVTSAPAPADGPGSLLLFPPAAKYSDIQLGSAPAMAVFNGRLYITFKAADSSHDLFVTSSSDGATWPAATQVPNVQIGGQPAMTTFNGKLYVAFKANDTSNGTFIASSSDGIHFTSQDLLQPMITGTDPGLVAYNNTLYYFYVGAATSKGAGIVDDQLMVMTSTDGTTWSDPSKYVGTEVGPFGPAAAAFTNGVYVGFVSDDSRNILLVTNNVGNN